MSKKIPEFTGLYHGVLHGGIDVFMPQKVLNLLYRHTFVYCHCRKRSSELVRMNLFHLGKFSEPPHCLFYAAYLQPIKRRF